MMTILTPIGGTAAWRAKDMRASRRWIYDLTPANIAELDEALQHVRRCEAAIPTFGRDEFPLSDFAQHLQDMRHEIEDGSGVVLLRGLPVERYSSADTQRLYWGIGAYLGEAVAQNPAADLMVEVRDAGVDPYRTPTVRGYRTARELPFHNDQADVVGLLCYRTAKSGGLSCIASAAAIHDEILATRPDLLEVLYQPFYSDVRGEEPPGRTPYYAEPRFARWNGRFFVQHGPTYVTSAQRFAEVPRLTEAQIAAMKLVDRLANDEAFRLDMDFRPGDIQFLNNHLVLHSRTEYVDHEEPDRKRLLFRLWLRTPAYASLPPFFDRRLDDMAYWSMHPTQVESGRGAAAAGPR